IIIPYDKTVKNKDKITAILIKEDGTRETVGGVYDNLTKTVKFLTNEPGKFAIEEGTKEFEDIAKHKWAREAIESMAVKGVIDGKDNNQFDPSANITRAEFSALISRSLKYNEASNNKVPFTDIDSAKWYYGSIVSVYENGLINGRAEEIFDPEGSITREEMAKIIGKVLENNYYKEQDKEELNKFEDNTSISPWAEKGTATATYNGIINGDNGNFKPRKNATRAETAVMLYRLYELIMD
ncbi:MAG TPA: S-layer homology domain-containing protein, partial [Oscillospiraceae bacterium]|nr:S-layer homology domain-containing protein [Oscillospiraceae bacterium]